MTRLLLTLLALLTGLAAQLSPAQAAVSASREVEIGTVEHARDAVQYAAHVAGVAAPIRLRQASIEALAQPHLAYEAPFVLTVIQGVDRARE